MKNINYIFNKANKNLDIGTVLNDYKLIGTVPSDPIGICISKTQILKEYFYITFPSPHITKTENIDDISLFVNKI